MVPSISHFCRWEYTTTADETVTVLPDGCCDVLLVSQGGCPALRLTGWDSGPRVVRIAAGTYMTGYRLRPGVRVDVDVFRGGLDNLVQADAWVAEGILPEWESIELIEALGTAAGTVARIARQQGVSPRTLQRHFRRLSLPSPAFWRLLGRARRAAQVLASDAPLVEIACQHGYSDQAHMTRESLRWFGKTPRQLRQSPDVLWGMAQPGLGTWSE
ncbi:MAG: AraC family transcriptional regulator [Rhodobacterales bacterium]|nr:MAG: AraC family transcriptional regulator [Rhodobacterales bacterium]